MSTAKTPLVVNTGRVPKQVGLIRESDGKKTTMRVMHRSKAHIAPGFKIDGNWLALNGKGITVRMPQTTNTITSTTSTAEATVTTASPTTPAQTVPKATTSA